MRKIHLVEPGGLGGIHQHTAALADALLAAGVDVTLHTAADAEPLPVRTPRRACLWRFGWMRPAALRRAALVLGWLLAGIPSCAGQVRPGDVVHLQGWFRPVLLVPLVVACRLRGCVLAFSPHNTFDRAGGRGRAKIVAWIARRAHVVFVFSRHDHAAVRAWGAEPVDAPFPVLVAAPRAELVAAWRRRWRRTAARRVVLFAGLLRDDKGLDLLIRAAARWDEGLLLAVVGQDAGALSSSRRLAERLGAPVTWDVGYQPHDRFLAAVAAADVVACPYRVASQSAVLALARAVGRPTVASGAGAGGLPELATVVADPADPDALTAAIERALTTPTPARPAQDVAPAYAEAYARAAAAVSPARPARAPGTR